MVPRSGRQRLDVAGVRRRRRSRHRPGDPPAAASGVRRPRAAGHRRGCRQHAVPRRQWRPRPLPARRRARRGDRLRRRLARRSLARPGRHWRAGGDGRGDRRRLGRLGRGAVVDERDGRRPRRRDRRRRGARPAPRPAGRLERATARARCRRPRRVVGRLAGEPGVRRRVLGPAARPVAHAHRAARARMGRPGVLRRRPATSAAAVPPGHGPRDRVDRHRVGAGVPPLGRRRRAREPPPRSPRARRRQPRQRLRRPDRRHVRPAPAAAVPGQGGAVEGGRRPPVPRVRRSAARVPLQ